MTVSARGFPFDLVQFPEELVDVSCLLTLVDTRSADRLRPDRSSHSSRCSSFSTPWPICRADLVDVSCFCRCESLTCPQAQATGRSGRGFTATARVLRLYLSGIGRPCGAVRPGPASPHQFDLSWWKRLVDSGSVWLFIPYCSFGVFSRLLSRSLADLCLD